MNTNPKGKSKATVQLMMMAFCFLMIVLLVIIMGKMSRASKPDYENAKLVQRKVPSANDTVAVFETTKGTFKAVIYEDEAPEICKYFKDLVKQGYYDGTYVFGVEKDVYFLGGSKAADGNDTQDTDTTTFDKELSPNLWPFKGSLISYGGKDNKFFSSNVSGSRIMFVNSVEFDDEMNKTLDSAGNKEVNEVFKKLGGVPNFAQQYTIFGQVYDGFDCYEKICAAGEGDSSTIVPTEEIKITKVTLSTYGEHKNDSFFADSSESK